MVSDFCHSGSQVLQRGLEEAMHTLLVHSQHAMSSYFCTGKEERRRRTKAKKKSKLDIWGVHHSFLLEQESRVFFPSIASTHLWRLWLYISQCLTLYREGLLSRVNGKKKKNSLHSCWIAGCAIANNNMKTNFLKSHKLARTLRSNCSSSIKQRHKWNHGSEELSCFFSSITGDLAT